MRVLLYVQLCSRLDGNARILRMRVKKNTVTAQLKKESYYRPSLTAYMSAIKDLRLLEICTYTYGFEADHCIYVRLKDLELLSRILGIQGELIDSVLNRSFFLQKDDHHKYCKNCWKVIQQVDLSHLEMEIVRMFSEIIRCRNSTTRLLYLHVDPIEDCSLVKFSGVNYLYEPKRSQIKEIIAFFDCVKNHVPQICVSLIREHFQKYFPDVAYIIRLFT
jgi:hypothetical protein